MEASELAQDAVGARAGPHRHAAQEDAGSHRAPSSAAGASRAARVRARLPALLGRVRVVAYVLAVAVVAYMAVRAARHVHPGDLSLVPLALSFPAAVVWWLLLARGWALVLRGRVSRRDISSWCRTQTLRYLPGGFWAPASRATIVDGGWLDKLSTVAAENVLALCASLAIGGVALALAGRPLWLPLVLVLAAPVIAARFTAARTRIGPARTLRATWNYVASFTAYAISAVLVQAAVSGLHHPFAVAGAAAIAWGVGLVVVVAPSGVGVREVVYVALLTNGFGPGQASAAAVTLRGVTILAELAVLLAAGRPPAEPAAPAPAAAAAAPGDGAAASGSAGR